jgi:hypothetical protein
MFWIPDSFSTVPRASDEEEEEEECHLDEEEEEEECHLDVKEDDIHDVTDINIDEIEDDIDVEKIVKECQIYVPFNNRGMKHMFTQFTDNTLIPYAYDLYFCKSPRIDEQFSVSQ